MAGCSRAPAYPLHLRDLPPLAGLYGRPPQQAGLYDHSTSSPSSPTPWIPAMTPVAASPSIPTPPSSPSGATSPPRTARSRTSSSILGTWRTAILALEDRLADPDVEGGDEGGGGEDHGEVEGARRQGCLGVMEHGVLPSSLRSHYRKTNYETYGNMCYIRINKVETSLCYLEKMMESGLMPIAETYHVLVSTLYGLGRDMGFFNRIIVLLCDKRLVSGAEMLLAEMLGKSLVPNAETYGIMIDGY